MVREGGPDFLVCGSFTRPAVASRRREGLEIWIFDDRVGSAVQDQRKDRDGRSSNRCLGIGTKLFLSFRRLIAFLGFFCRDIRIHAVGLAKGILS